MKRLIIAAVGVVGLVVIGLGVASATAWRADDVLVAGTSDGPHTLVTDPGVLELGGDPVTIRVTAADQGAVTLAIGRDTDVAGWVGTEAHGQVTGLDGWHRLAVKGVEDTTPTPTPTPSTTAAAPAVPVPSPTPSTDASATETPTAADPAGSDLWVAQATGKGTASLTWPQQEGRWSLIAVSTGAGAPDLTLAWPRDVTTPWLWPAVVVGLLLVLLSAWLLFRDVRRHRQGRDEEWHPVTTGTIPMVLADDVDAIPVLTRRQMREAAQARPSRPAPRTGQVAAVAPPLDDTDSRTATTPVGAPPTGATPVTSRRALRGVSTETSPTGTVPVVPAPSVSSTAAAPVPPSVGGWAPAQPRPAAAPGAVTPTDPSGAHGRPSWLNPATPEANKVAAAATAGAIAASGASDGHGESTDVAERTAPPEQNAPEKPAAPTAPVQPVLSGPDTAAARAATGWADVTAPTPSVGGAVAENDPHAGRPTWLAPPAPAAGSPAGSRADAWRRAWGLPPTEGEALTTPDEPTTTDEQEEDR